MSPFTTCRHLALLSMVCLGLIIPANARADGLLPPDRPISEVIDHYIDAKLAEVKVKPASAASDTTIVRRLYLDLAGRIPTPAETREALKPPFDKNKLIESLTLMPEFARQNANEFDVMLRNSNTDAPSLRSYLVEAFRENRPWDVMFQDLIGASEKGHLAKPEAFVLKRLKDQDALTRDISSVFFGMNITCAQCHRHPEVKSLTQDYFFGMKAFFTPSYDFQGNLLEKQYVKLGDFKDKKGDTRTISMMFLSGAKVEMKSLPEKELLAAIQAESKAIQEKSKEYAKSKELPPAAKFRARKRLAEIALDEDNREMFARSIVNRLWFRFFGHGLVMRVDQMHAENQGSHPELLKWLARDLVAHQYDLKRLMVGLVGSRAYARSSEWRGAAPEKELFALAANRPLTPAQWVLSHRVLAEPETFSPGDSIEDREKKFSAIDSKGTPFPFIEQPRDEFQIGIDEPLRLSNDDTVLKSVTDKQISELRKLKDARQQLDQAVFITLSRPASPEEIQLFVEYLEQRKEKPEEGLRQVIWALINSPEFRFNH